jgi:hypothetical protein
MKIIKEKYFYAPHLRPVPSEWEKLRRKIASQAGRHAIIAGGAIRDHILGLPVKDIDIFILGMPAQEAKEIFGADIIEYAGVEEAKHQCRSDSGLALDLVFSQYDNVYEVLAHFDLGICRVAWDGWDFVVTDDFVGDWTERQITAFYPSPSGHCDRVLAKLGSAGFKLADVTKQDWYIEQVRWRAARQGYRLMHRRNGQYWLMQNQPMSLEEIEAMLRG